MAADAIGMKARGRFIRRWKTRQCRSVQSIMSKFELAPASES